MNKVVALTVADKKADMRNAAKTADQGLGIDYFSSYLNSVDCRVARRNTLIAKTEIIAVAEAL